ncbi:hypothetical protein [Paraburkholderia caribensis]|jgi:hypothetical protein|uniref:hypothetical protein n=1 Tax=Paraburkholderia caribensis TaxID=75105 RepID=UPI001CB0B2CC|nr:hypothetical protein [Paraburkholderia caribensis]GJH38182.1 hypothetical protein CBA19CS91_35515 [Paraburkholderia hospita]CAG9242429.1 hypothetical protein PCAR4_120051 [Paraburkholderia caribensis]
MKSTEKTRLCAWRHPKELRKTTAKPEATAFATMRGARAAMQRESLADKSRGFNNRLVA